MSVKDSEGLGLVIPTGVEGEEVVFEHTLEQANGVAAVPEDQPVLGLVSPDNLEAQLFVELPRGLDVLTARLTENAPSCMCVSPGLR